MTGLLNPKQSEIGHFLHDSRVVYLQQALVGHGIIHSVYKQL